MIKLNLATSSEEHEIIKEYLEQNVSEILANKINNGVRIEKDGITLINKKDLDGFMKYATDEARKIAEKGKQYKAVYHDVVFGWAIHYFEEDSIEGTLFNEDGSEYKPVVAKTTKSKVQTKVELKPIKMFAKKPEMQFSLFDILKDDKPVSEPIKEPVEEDDEPNEEDIKEAMDIAAKEEPKPKVSTVYQKYVEIENQYPGYAVFYRLGDFYEVFGENAKKIANEIEITLTGRDWGLSERIPLIGIPFHAAENYFKRVLEFLPIVIVENGKITVKDMEKTIRKVDLETGEIYDDLTEEEMREFDGDIYEPKHIDENDGQDDFLETAKRIDKDIMLKLYSLLDEKLTVE